MIRLRRIGKRHQPGFRLVVGEKRSKLGGPPVEDLGTYDPSTKKAAVNRERVLYWIGKGAKPSVTVHNLLVRTGVLSGPKMKVKIGKRKKEEAPAAPVPAGTPPAAAAEPATA